MCLLTLDDRFVVVQSSKDCFKKQKTFQNQKMIKPCGKAFILYFLLWSPKQSKKLWAALIIYHFWLTIMKRFGLNLNDNHQQICNLETPMCYLETPTTIFWILGLTLALSYGENSSKCWDNELTIYKMVMASIK